MKRQTMSTHKEHVEKIGRRTVKLLRIAVNNAQPFGGISIDALYEAITDVETEHNRLRRDSEACLTSACTELQTEVEQLQKTLAFYGEQENYRPTRLDADHGGMYSEGDGDQDAVLAKLSPNVKNRKAKP